MIDFNCFSGNWPFHKVRNNTFEKIRKAHIDNNIEYGYISSLESIFYNDFFESESELYRAIKDTNYKQVITVNPMLDGCIENIMRCIKEFDIAGIRLLPGFHGYTLDCDILKPVLEIVREYKLPVFLNLRMEDERVLHMFEPKTVETDDIERFIKQNNDITILLCNIRIHEIMKIRDSIINCPKVFCDTSGLKGWRFDEEELGDVTNRIIYGSLAPIFALKSTVLFVEKGICNNKTKEMIKSGANFLLSINDKI